MTATEAIAEAVTPTQSPLDCGDSAWVVYWRPFPMPDNPNHGTWEADPTRIIAIGANGVVCHEVSNASAARDEGAFNDSLTRWTPATRIFRTREEAAEAARELPPPK